MQNQELIVRCLFKEEGESIQNLLLSSFACFLHRELQKFASGWEHHVSCP